MSDLATVDFSEPISLESFKKSNNETGVLVQRNIELEKLRRAVEGGYANLRFFLK